MGITKDAAVFTANTSFNDFDDSLVNHLKHVLLSGVGMTLAGTDTKSGKAVIDYVKSCKGPEQAGVWGAGFRTSAEYAALANGTTSHSTELEDDTFPPGTYSVGIFPPIFALGEKLHVSGKQVIEGVVIAWDIAAKLGMVALPMVLRGIGPWCTFPTIGVAAVSAKLLNLDVDTITMAISIAASHCSGLSKQAGTGAHLLESGLCGRSGIAAAMMAKHGLTGNQEILELHPNGYLEAVSGVTNPEVTFGAPFIAANIGIKRYPCCFIQQHPIHSVLDLINRHNIAADDVETVQAFVNPMFTGALPFHHPKDEDEARFSLQHSFAVAFLDRKAWLDNYATERVIAPEVAAFRDRVKIAENTGQNTEGLDGMVSDARSNTLSGLEIPIIISLKDGTQYKTIAPGIDQHLELSEQDVLNKFMDCALRAVTRSRAEQISDIVLSLETVEDISQLMELVTFPDKG